MADNKTKHKGLAETLKRFLSARDFIGAERFLYRIDMKTIVANKQELKAMLFAAAESGHKNIVKFLVKCCNANTDDGGKCDTFHSVTPLWCAARYDRLEVVKLLQELEADINAVSNTETTAVNYACFARRIETVRFLVKQGADIHRPDERGETCLMKSVHSLELCQFLIDNGARVNEQDMLGNTALHHAIKKGDLKIVQLLLDHGSDQNIKNMYGDDALQIASYCGKVLILKNLSSPTHLRYIESLQLLGCHYIFSNVNDLVALSFWTKSIELQLRYARAKLLKIESMPVFMNSKEVNTVKELKDLCQDHEMKYMYAFEILLRILGPGHIKAIDGLDTVSNIFVWHGQYRRSFELLKNTFQLLQACTSTRNEEYFRVLKMLLTACQSAIRGNQFQIEFHEVYEILEMVTSKAQAQNSHNISDGIKLILSLVIFVIKLDKSPDQLVSFKRTIHRLVQSRIRDELDRTFLHHAVLNCSDSPSVLEVLLECGADVNAVDLRHNTALHLCSTCPFSTNSVLRDEKSKVIELLLQYSAHPDIVNDEGHFAANGLSLNMLNHVNLKCLATAVIRNHQIPYVGQIPESLESFVQMHGSRSPRNF